MKIVVDKGGKSWNETRLCGKSSSMDFEVARMFAEKPNSIIRYSKLGGFKDCKNFAEYKKFKYE